MALPYRTTGSLSPGFPPARPVGLAVKLPCAIALAGWFPISLREPSRASVTFWEATAPVKLPTSQCPRPGSRDQVRHQDSTGWYFTVASTRASARASQAPTYPTQSGPSVTGKLEQRLTGSFRLAAGKLHLH